MLTNMAEKFVRLFFNWVEGHSRAWVVFFLLNAVGNVDVCLRGGQHPPVCCHERWDRAGWGSILHRRRGQVSVCDLSGVPLGFGFLPPLGQEGLLVVSHALKLSVRMLWVRGGRFFGTYHVLKVNKKTLSQQQASILHLLPFYLAKPFSFYKSVTCAPCNSVPTVLLPTSQVQAVCRDGRGWPELNGCGTASVANTSQPHTTHCWRKTQPPTPSCFLFSAAPLSLPFILWDFLLVLSLSATQTEAWKCDIWTTRWASLVVVEPS